MAFRLLPTLRLARQLSREMSPFWAAPRPSFWWDYPRLPSASDFFKDHFSQLDRLTKPRDIRNAQGPAANTMYGYYKYTIVSKPDSERVKQSEEGSEDAAAAENNATAAQGMSPQEFQLGFDLKEFTPEEIQVKIVDDNLLHVEANHASKKDGSEVESYFSHFCHLPDNVDISALKSAITKDGILKMTAPLITKQDSAPTAERIIPIQQDHGDSEAAEDASENAKENRE